MTSELQKSILTTVISATKKFTLHSLQASLKVPVYRNLAGLPSMQICVVSTAQTSRFLNTDDYQLQY